MPIVTVETWPMEKEKKPLLIERITKVFVDMGIPPQAVTVLIKEIELDNWGSAGEQHSMKFKTMKR